MMSMYFNSWHVSASVCKVLLFSLLATSAAPSSHNSLPPSYHSVISDFTNDDSLEEFMEILKPENTHLEQLAKNLDGSVSDPNQCLICKRVLSCKSALMVS